MRRSGATDPSKSGSSNQSNGQSAQSSNFDKNQQIRQSLPTQSKTRNYAPRHDKGRKSLGPGMRNRGESSSSLPVGPTQAGRSGSPSRRHISPQRRERGTSKTRQPSPSRLRMQRQEFQKVLVEQQNLIKDHVSYFMHFKQIF